MTHCSQIAFYELRKKEYPVSGMRVEQQVLEITLFYIQVNRGQFVRDGFFQILGV